MEAINIEILNSKAMKLIKGMEDLKLIKVKKTQTSSVQSYLKKMRRNAATAPDLNEITKVVEEVRAEHYAKKSH